MVPAIHTQLANLAGERLHATPVQVEPSEHVLGLLVLRGKQSTHAIRERDDLIVALHEVLKNPCIFCADHQPFFGLFLQAFSGP